MASWLGGKAPGGPMVGTGIAKQLPKPKTRPIPFSGKVAPQPFRPGAPQATPGGAPAPAPYKMPTGTLPWAPTPLAAPAPAGGPDPAAFEAEKDSAYNNAIASLLAGKSQGEQMIASNARRASEDRSKNLGLLGEGRSKTKTAETQSANKSGLFYSGILGKRLGDVDTDYGRRENDVNTAFARDEEGRAAQLAALTQSFASGQRDAYQGAWERYINAATATETPSTGAIDDILAALMKGSGSNARRG